YCACILILAGLCARGRKPWPIQLQVVLVYFGAALNKLLQQDWRSGQFFAFWFGHIHHPQLWNQITSLVPAMPLAKFACWATIIVEFVLVAGFLVPRWYSWSIWLGAAYHTTLLVVMNSTFGMFYYAMLASYLAFVEWPRAPIRVLYEEDNRLSERVRRFFAWSDPVGVFVWERLNIGARDATAPSIQEGPFLVGRNRVLSGFAAFKRILL